jgi:glycosyltransferase involved in cell wall biosynthesis
MHILMILPYTPTLIRTRPYHLLKALLKAGVQVTLATVWENNAEREQLEEWGAQGVRILSTQLDKTRKVKNLALTLPTRIPLQARYCWQPNLASQIDAVLKRTAFNALHVEHLRGAEYGLYAKAHLQARGVWVPTVWDSVDCISLLFEQAAKISHNLFGRWVTRFELRRTRRYEAKMVGQFDHILVTAPNDMLALNELAGGNQPEGKISVLLNGVDLEYFTQGHEPRAKDLIIFSGKMSYHANVHAALNLVKQIMPVVWMHKPNIRVQLAGKDPPREVRMLAEEDRRVEVTGTVKHLPAYLQKATLAVAPVMYGVGIQNKVLEAMACATPVLTTPQGVSALGAVVGRDVLTAGTTEEFALKLIKLIDNQIMAEELGLNGRKYVEKNHDWNLIIMDLLDYYGRGRS